VAYTLCDRRIEKEGLKEANDIVGGDSGEEDK
jgi:hypothetical protein